MGWVALEGLSPSYLNRVRACAPSLEGASQACDSSRAKLIVVIKLDGTQVGETAHQGHDSAQAVLGDVIGSKVQELKRRG